MEREQVVNGVRASLQQWTEISAPVRQPLRLSDGAESLIVQIILNIQDDPSPHWDSANDLDAVQRYVIAILPNILMDEQYRYRIRSIYEPRKISSWELLHHISDSLEKWCPIPKDI